ncbi:MAG: 16S rRNA (adenine(1518)-N(6)/adenine(1519)-N(6))-dimethyltransferase RsmA [Actinomycetales bacterium]
MTISLLGALEIRAIADELDLHPRKSLGQNFVIDSNVCQKIARLARVESGDNVVEIGPGIGSLTLALLERGATVVAIEVDPRLATKLPNTLTNHGGEKFQVLTDDALAVTSLPISANKLVANLPYNISVPVLLHFLESFPEIRSGIVMVQSEVAERLAAKPGNKDYGAPSAKAAWWAKVELSDSVSRKVFWPVPNVDSSLVAFQRVEPIDRDETLRKRTFRIIDLAFGKRRKMLRASLSELFGNSKTTEAALQSIGIDPTLRGESLSISDFFAIARLLPIGD